MGGNNENLQLSNIKEHLYKLKLQLFIKLETIKSERKFWKYEHVLFFYFTIFKIQTFTSKIILIKV